MSDETLSAWANKVQYGLAEESIVCETDVPKDIAKKEIIESGAGINFLTIGISIVVVGMIQFLIFKIYASNKNTYRALTHFVTTMLGLVMGGYIVNLLVSDPSQKIMSVQESMTIVSFIKDICLMVFAYYFGTQSNSEPSEK
jgi:hypothetical protein